MSQPESACVQALGIALKLTFSGNNQLLHLETGYCVVVSPIRVGALTPASGNGLCERQDLRAVAFEAVVHVCRRL